MCSLQFLNPLLSNTFFSNCTCFVVIHTIYNFTGLWNFGEAQNFYRHRRTSNFYFFTALICHGTYFTVCSTSKYCITYTTRTFLYQDSTYSTTTFIKLSLDNYAICLTVRVRFQFHNLCYKQNIFK